MTFPAGEPSPRLSPSFSHGRDWAALIILATEQIVEILCMRRTA